MDMLPIRYLQLEMVTSTNTWVREHQERLRLSELTCVFAHTQTAGRGRFKRKWLSAPGQNIYATLFFSLPFPCSFLGNLGQILSLSCVQVIERQGVTLQIKWPNDLYIQGKKLGGTLCETIPYQDRVAIILGWGINVDLSSELLMTIDQPATSLKEVSTRSWTRQELLEPIVELFVRHLEVLKNKGFSPFLTDYTMRLMAMPRRLVHQEGLHTVEGCFESINDQGQLILRLDSGKKITLSSGELQGVIPWDDP